MGVEVDALRINVPFVRFNRLIAHCLAHTTQHNLDIVYRDLKVCCVRWPESHPRQQVT
jgi:hypothetical protein